jgi:hypothetical protein
LFALQGVVHLRVELYAPNAVVVVGEGSVFDVGRRADDMITFGDGGDRVTVTHPHLRAFLKTFKDRRLCVDGLEVRAAILAGARLLHVATERVADKLGSVADAEHGVVADDLREVNLERFLVVDRVRTATEDDTDDGRVVLRELVVRQNLTERVQLAHTTADELRGLRSEVENDDFLLHII